ncbi:hypothetical protein [Prosthecomicrobium pneumaticum]|uniref:Aldolase n=1 Tax=Prosthecomicrobium pneumaticum TaxID=81895 RepID=A0A7W9CTI2_9HYPH|nr:hypothetical protein [Prosthecomicrobium pneumaticum]
MTRLEEKLARIRAGQYRRSDFVIADAKDGDMGSGVTATAPHRGKDGSWSRYRTRAEFLDQIAEIVAQDVVDIMLVSASNLELLQERGVFANSRVKPAIRANDATDCWGGVRHQRYTRAPSRPHRTASLPRIMHGGLDPDPTKPVTGTDLGLYSMTFVNDVEMDLAAGEAFAAFREDAARNGFKYFLEVFNPNVDCGLDRAAAAEFVNDNILRVLGGVTKADRPQFLKIPFNGPAALEELASFDPDLVVGVLGGGAGTTRDTFELIAQTERYGGRLALFGRKINLAESQTTIVAMMRRVAEGDIAPDEAVRAYHATLKTLGITPTRSLEDDLVITEEPLKHAAQRLAA